MILHLYTFSRRSYAQKLKTSNIIEIVNENLKPREYVIGIYPNEASNMRLMCTILIELNKKQHQRKYMNLFALTGWKLSRRPN